MAQDRDRDQKRAPRGGITDEERKETAAQFAQEYADKMRMLKSGKTADAKAGIEALIKDMEYLVDSCPTGPAFLGKRQKYEESKGWFGAKKSDGQLNMTPFKQAIQNTEKKQVSMIRQELENALKRFPNNAELHALHAIQVFQDINQAGIRSKKLNAMRASLTEMALSIYNGCDQITYAIWFINMYIAYIEYLKDRIMRTTKSADHIPNQRVIELRRELHVHLMQLNFLQGVKEKMVGVNRLATLLKGTIYVNESISILEIKAASQMLLKGQEMQNIKDTKKKASHIIYIYFTLTLLYANVPILKEKVKENLINMPEIHRDLILQKRMIIAADGINEFKAELFSGYAKEARESASKLMKFLSDTIKDHLETAIMTKQFEIDPYIKIAWITLEARDLFPLSDLHELVSSAREGLEVLFSKRCQIKGAAEQGRELYNALTALELSEESRHRDMARNAAAEAKAAEADAVAEAAYAKAAAIDMPTSLR